MRWHCREFEFNISTPIIMGVLNVTPDSFSDGGNFICPDDAVAHAKELIEAGASIIDVGGESTRPGASEVSADEEWQRIGSVVEQLCAEGMCVSVDTRHADVARLAVEAGASIINDVSGFTDPAMQEVALSCEAGLVVMHMRGTPETMQSNTEYTDVVAEVRDWLRQRTAQLENLGIAHERICIDPGPGFGKTAKQTIELMRNIHEFVRLGYPVMAAPSRKSYIAYAYHIDDPDPKARDTASAVEALMACELGASVVRTHNVAETAAALSQLRPYVVLSLGSNVALVAESGEEQEAKIAQINYAVGQLCQLPDSQIIDMASFYESEPAYYENQDKFVNTAILLRSGIAPKELLDYLHSVENSLGRVRERENGPRTIDIDIVDYQMYNYSTDDLTLPHPRATERDFVVKPVSEMLPGHVLANGVALEEIPEQDRLGRACKIA
ncbi:MULTISPECIES: dihydropteroate synthase [unclassified Adlercreutzia]|uniref:dihydropteroate synthase n=1 Tax=unclassified Adlercreutzia TaxID=2636013 RepID=UPI0013EB708B|nr:MULTISPECIES: dihydropteroate synthase [unclassified Adlercreutzia]